MGNSAFDSLSEVNPTGHTTLSGYVLAICHAIEDAGVDYLRLLTQVGIDHNHLRDFGFRFSQEKVTALWHAAIEITGDQNFSLKVARQIRPSSYHVVGQAMLFSGTLRAASRRFARFSRLISDSASIDLVEDSDMLKLSITVDTGGALLPYQTVDTVLAGFLESCRWIMQGTFDPLEIYFSHQLSEHAEEYQQLFRCPIHYGQSFDAVIFSAADMDQPIPCANEELASLLDQLAARYMVERLGGRFSRKIREFLLVKLPDGEPSRADAAESLHMSERTLARRLSDENTTYYEILKQVREEKAYGYLKHTEASIEEIAHLLGFSDGGSFSRAFKGWSGKRPSQWRIEQLQFLDLSTS